MNFKKLVLASAIAMLPAAAFSVEILDDEMMSGVTGQDGISINIASAGIGADIVLHDTDGLTGTSQAGHNFAGAITITGFNLAIGAGGIGVTIDAGDSVQNSGDDTTPVLHVGVSIPANTSITTGAIKVGNSERDDAGWDVEALTETGTLLNSTTITLNGATTMTIQLGNEPQGHMIEIGTTITGGLTLANLGLSDAGGVVTGGGMGAATTLIQNAGAADLAVDVGVDATTGGMVIDLVQIGAGGGIDVKMTDVYLGEATDIIGDLYIKNLDVDGTTITITGK